MKAKDIRPKPRMRPIRMRIATVVPGRAGPLMTEGIIYRCEGHNISSCSNTMAGAFNSWYYRFRQELLVHDATIILGDRGVAR